MKRHRYTYRILLMVALLWVSSGPLRLQAQGNLPCPPVDVNRPDQITSIASAKSSITFVSVQDFQNGVSNAVNLFVNAKGGKNYAIRYRFLNGTTPVLSSGGTTIPASNAFQATASFGAAGWGTLNVQIPNSNVTLANDWNTLATFKARCAVTHGNLIVNLKALGQAAGVTNFFVPGGTPPISYGNLPVEFQLVNLDNAGAVPDQKNTSFEILIGDVLTVTLNNASTTIVATPMDYVNGIEVTAADQLVVTSNNTYDVSVSAASANLVATGGGAVGNITFADLSLRISNTVPGMGTTFSQTLGTITKNLATRALGRAWNKPISLVYRLQNSRPGNLNPGTYSGTIFVTVTEN